MNHKTLEDTCISENRAELSNAGNYVCSCDVKCKHKTEYIFEAVNRYTSPLPSKSFETLPVCFYQLRLKQKNTEND